MKIASAFVAISSTLLVAGCSTTYHQTRAQADRQLESNLQAELSSYGDLAAADPDVRFYALGGNVTITGAVHSEKHREMIETMVRNTSGVRGVNDQTQLVIPPTGTSSQSPGYAPSAPVYSENPAPISPAAPVVSQGGTVAINGYPDLRARASTKRDEPIARQVGNQLRYDAVPPEWLEGMSMFVSEGTVYLQGTVADQGQRDAIISSVRHAPGVKLVYDRLQVR